MIVSKAAEASADSNRILLNIHWLKRSFPQLLFPHPGKIADDFTPSYNSDIIRQTPVLIAVTYIKGRCGFERDGSYTTGKKDRWQMFDAGVACQTFCLAAHEYGLGTVIMGVFDESGISSLLDIPKERELAALIALGYPDIEPSAPKRKTVEDLLQYR